MVKVKEEAVMAEPKPATAPQSSSHHHHHNNSTNNSINNNHIRKSRPHTHTHHHHVTFPHYTHFHHHCTYPTDNGDASTTNGATTPAKFYFGPGFEPQQQIPGGGGFGPGPSQSQSGEYVVFFHVNPGVTISLQIGDNLEVLRGKFLQVLFYYVKKKFP